MSHRAVLVRAVRVSAVVGTILSVVNQGDRILSGALQGTGWLRVGFNYLVPFLVALYSGARGAAGSREA